MLKEDALDLSGIEIESLEFSFMENNAGAKGDLEKLNSGMGMTEVGASVLCSCSCPCSCCSSSSI